MANTDLSTGKSIVVLAVVVGCFAILWPKIFYPMFQTSIAAKDNVNERPLQPNIMHPRIREAVKSAPAEGPLQREPGRPFPMPMGSRPDIKELKGSGAMGFIMPLYTIAIIVFFVYAILKLLTRKKPEEEEEDVGGVVRAVGGGGGRVEAVDEIKPQVRDYQMDAAYRKFVLSEKYDEKGEPLTLSDRFHHNPKTNDLRKALKSRQLLDDYGKDRDSTDTESMSDALRTLIRDMDQFKGYLVEVEACRSKLAQLEAAKEATQQCLRATGAEVVAVKEDTSDAEEAESDHDSDQMEDQSDNCDSEPIGSSEESLPEPLQNTAPIDCLAGKIGKLALDSESEADDDEAPKEANHWPLNDQVDDCLPVINDFQKEEDAEE